MEILALGTGLKLLLLFFLVFLYTQYIFKRVAKNPTPVNVPASYVKCKRNEFIEATIPFWGREVNSNTSNHLCITKSRADDLRSASRSFLQYEHKTFKENTQCDYMNALVFLGAESKNKSRRASNSTKMDLKTLRSHHCYVNDHFEDLVNQAEKMVTKMETSEDCLNVTKCKNELFSDTKEFLRKINLVYTMDESPNCQRNESIKATVPVRGREVQRKFVGHLCIRKTITQVLRNASLDFLINEKQCEYMNILLNLGEESKDEAQISSEAVDMDLKNLIDYDCFSNATFFDLVNQTKLMVHTMKEFEDCVYVDECKEKLFRSTGKFIIDLDQIYILPRDDTTTCERTESIQDAIPVRARELKSKSIDHLCIKKTVTQVLRNTSTDFLKYELEPIHENVECKYMNLLSSLQAGSKNKAISASDPVDIDFQILSSYHCFHDFQFAHLANLAEVMVEKMEFFKDCLNVEKCKDQFFRLIKEFIDKLDQFYVMPTDDTLKCQRNPPTNAIAPRLGRQIKSAAFDHICLAKDPWQDLQNASHEFLMYEKQCDYMNVLLNLVEESEDEAGKEANSVVIDLESLRSFVCLPNLEFRNLVNLKERIVEKIEASENCVDEDECKDQLFRDTENFIIQLNKIQIKPIDENFKCKRDKTVKAIIPHRGLEFKSKSFDHFCINKSMTEVLRNATSDFLRFGQESIEEYAQCDFINILLNLGAESKNEAQMETKFFEMNPTTLRNFDCFSKVRFVDLVNQTEMMLKKMETFEDCLYVDKCKEQLLRDTEELLTKLRSSYILDEKEFFRCNHLEETVPFKPIFGTNDEKPVAICMKKGEKESFDTASKEFRMYRKRKVEAAEKDFLIGEEKEEMGNKTALCQYIQKVSSLEKAYKDLQSNPTKKLPYSNRLFYDHFCYSIKNFDNMMSWTQKVLQPYGNDTSCYWSGDCLNSVIHSINSFQNMYDRVEIRVDAEAKYVLSEEKSEHICFLKRFAKEIRKELVPVHTEEEFEVIIFLAKVYRDMSYKKADNWREDENYHCMKKKEYSNLRDAIVQLSGVNSNAYLEKSYEYETVMRALNTIRNAVLE